MSKEFDKPMFEGNLVATSVSLMDDDDDYEEPTRRVGGMPSFEPVSFAAPVMPAPFVESRPGKVQTAPVVQQKQVSTAWLWELKEVPILPEYHPLERTAVFIPNAAPVEVAKRISSVLRDRSIEASYEDEKAKVKCMTADGVDFRVRLYRGRGKFSHGIIVEVQRRFGASVNFHSDTQAILDAAEGKKVAPPTPASGSLPMVSDAEDDYSVNSSSLEVVAKMFSHMGYDSHYLAYQTLIPLTDSSKMGRGTARCVSTELLKPGNPVGSKVMSLVLYGREEDDMFKLRTMAMTVLANAIQAVKGKVDLSIHEQLRPVLLRELAKADKNPRCAQMAGVIVEYLLDADHNAGEFYAVCETALEVGQARHAGLARQAKRCLDKIQ